MLNCQPSRSENHRHFILGRLLGSREIDCNLARELQLIAVLMLILVAPAQSARAQTTNVYFTATGTVTQRALNDAERLPFDPRSYGALADGSVHTIGSLYAGATVESLAASNSAYSFLTDPRAGLKFTLTLTSITDSMHLVFTATQPGGNGVPSVANVPQFTFDPLNLSKEVLSGMTVTDTTASGATTGLTVDSVVPWPVMGTTQPSGTPGTVVLSGAETGMSAGDTIQFEVPASMLDANYTVDWLGVTAAAYAADTAGHSKVELGPGLYHMGQGAVWLFGDNPTAVEGAGQYETTLQWDTDAPIGGFYMGDSKGNVNYRFESEYKDFQIYGQRVSSATYGVAPRNGTGLMLGQNSVARRLSINTGYAGIELLGDHQELDEIQTETVFYGAFYGPFGTSNGNVLIQNSGLQAYMASVAVSYNANQNDNVYEFGEWGLTPHMLYKETNFNSLIPASALSPSCMTNTRMSWVAGEEIGGIPIDCAGGGAFVGNTIEYFQPGMASDTALYVPGENADYFIYAPASFSGNRFVDSDFQIDAGSWPTVAWIYAGGPGPNDFGDMGNTVTKTGLPFLSVPASVIASVQGSSFEDREITNAGGSVQTGYQRLMTYQAYGTLAAGEIACPGNFGYPEVVPCSSTTLVPVGVVVQAGSTTAQTVDGAQTLSVALIADQGVASVLHETTTETSAPDGTAVRLYGTAGQGTVSNTSGTILGSLYNYMSSGSDPAILVLLK